MTTDDGTEALPFRRVLGARIKQLRGEIGMSQEQLADAAKRHGFRWSRPTITEIEAGRRSLRAEEFLVLPFLFNEAAQASTPPLTHKVTLNDLVNPGLGGARIAITPALVLDGAQVKEWLDLTLPPIEEV